VSPYELRQRAHRYRVMALRITDRRAVEVLHSLADEHQAMADEIEGSGGSGGAGVLHLACRRLD
jgi:hypothetical protein